MSSIPRPQRYTPFAQFLHWVTALLVVAAFALGPDGSEAHVYSAPLDLQRRIHETLGLVVLALTLFRLSWRTLHKVPERFAAPRWMLAAAKSTEWLLYLLLLVVPVTAIAGAWLWGHPLTWLGGDVAPWLPVAPDAGKAISEIHGWLGDALLCIAGFHAAAAIFHQLALRDQVLGAMFPHWWR